MSVLPPEAHVIAGKLEDQFETWNKRDSSHPHPSTAAAGQEIVDLCDEMVKLFHSLRCFTHRELVEYLMVLHNANNEGTKT